MNEALDMVLRPTPESTLAYAGCSDSGQPTGHMPDAHDHIRPESEREEHATYR